MVFIDKGKGIDKGESENREDERIDENREDEIIDDYREDEITDDDNDRDYEIQDDLKEIDRSFGKHGVSKEEADQAAANLEHRYPYLFDPNKSRKSNLEELKEELKNEAKVRKIARDEQDLRDGITPSPPLSTTSSSAPASDSDGDLDNSSKAGPSYSNPYNSNEARLRNSNPYDSNEAGPSNSNNNLDESWSERRRKILEELDDNSEERERVYSPSEKVKSDHNDLSESKYKEEEKVQRSNLDNAQTSNLDKDTPEKKKSKSDDSDSKGGSGGVDGSSGGTHNGEDENGSGDNNKLRFKSQLIIVLSYIIDVVSETINMFF